MMRSEKAPKGPFRLLEVKSVERRRHELDVASVFSGRGREVGRNRDGVKMPSGKWGTMECDA